jgi:hypothetical protein
VRASRSGESSLLLLDVVDVLASGGIDHAVIGALAASPLTLSGIERSRNQTQSRSLRYAGFCRSSITAPRKRTASPPVTQR